MSYEEEQTAPVPEAFINVDSYIYPVSVSNESCKDERKDIPSTIYYFSCNYGINSTKVNFLLQCCIYNWWRARENCKVENFSRMFFTILTILCFSATEFIHYMNISQNVILKLFYVCVISTSGIKVLVFGREVVTRKNKNPVELENRDPKPVAGTQIGYPKPELGLGTRKPISAFLN